MKRRIFVGVIGLLVVTLGAGLALYVLVERKPESSSSATAKAAVSLIDEQLLESWPQVDRSTADTSRLLEGMTPPTNTWFSGMALQANPEPVFSYPNSFRPTDGGFEMGLPAVSATEETIIGPHKPDITVKVSGATKYVVTRYDELTVSLSYYSAASSKLATVTLAAGVPYVFVTAADDVSIEYGARGATRDGAAELVRGGTTYGVRTDGGVAANSLNLSAGDAASFFSASSDNDFPLLAQHALNVVESGSVDYDNAGAASRTTLRYETANEEPTLITRLPHQQQTKDEMTSVTYSSILGELTSTIARSIEYEVPSVDVVERLPIEDLNEAQKSELRRQLVRDVDVRPEDRTDTYFGGKQLQRTAQLLLIADQLDARDQREALKSTLRDRLTDWLAQDGAFQFDTKAKTVVGKETSFGADTDINDHHFHYGYTIYAAAVLARFDESFAREHEAAVNLLVADIANYHSDETLPERRNYDPYFGHSWASGTAPFKDGNNQESTSEAMNAWTGVALWGQRTKNDALTKQAAWMLANETATAKQYWLNKPTIAGYESPLASIVWGGKREYKTFFSDDPNPKLAILLLPLTPSMRQYATSIDESTFEGTDVSKPFGDYLLMAKSNSTVEQARALPDTAIDDGNSRTYLYAYIMTK
ncbi:MAG: glycosyl hydrolase [Patescibacteria group bacterium]